MQDSRSPGAGLGTPAVECPIPHFSFQKGAHECPLCGRYLPSMRISAEPSSLRAMQPTSTRQSKQHYVKKWGLRGRPWVFRVPFGTRPLSSLFSLSELKEHYLAHLNQPCHGLLCCQLHPVHLIHPGVLNLCRRSLSFSLCVSLHL